MSYVTHDVWEYSVFETSVIIAATKFDIFKKYKCVHLAGGLFELTTCYF